MNEKLQHLLVVKNDMDKDLFRFAAASVVIKHFIDKLKNQGKYMERSKLLFRVNLSLRSIGIDEVSYGFIRSMY